MYKVIVFAGTTEGYEISRWLSEKKVSVLSCVATEYGARALRESEYLKVQAGRLDQEEMKKLLKEERPELVVDATHPYAVEVTKNIKTACVQTACDYQRLLRGRSVYENGAVYVESAGEAVAYLERTQGNILLTTGSKELRAFTALSDYQERIYARVLSLPSVIADCAALGVEGKHLIGMQGPFSTQMNLAMLRQYECRYLVTKDSGTAGGFLEKYEAAMQAKATLVVIGRPREEEGDDLFLVKQKLARRFHLSVRQKVTLLGIGMGSPDTMTVEGRRACQEADLIVGARRMTEAAMQPGKAVCYEYRADKICGYLREHPEFERIVVALSGDVGFYSGARKLLELLREQAEVEVICGISSVVYFMAKIGLSWDDAKIVSAHGRDCNLLAQIQRHRKVFAILGRGDSVKMLARSLTEYGLSQAVLHVGERLSYPDEKIFSARAGELLEYSSDPLSVVCVENPWADAGCSTHGLPDEAFLRGKAPMTKAEVRCVSLGKLMLREDSICYDVGAGTGSVSVEMALRAPLGRVYAIEKNPEAVRLLWENKKKFRVDHLTIVEGTAPEAMEALEPPTHAFIGGSSGNLGEIVKCLLEKNPRVRMVINCITLETVSEALRVIKEWQLECTDLVQVAVSRSKNLGRYHMMMGENPIYIITCHKGEQL